MKGLSDMLQGENIYTLKNKDTGATVKSTEKYLPQWFARGFEVVEITSNNIFRKVNELN